MTHRLTSTIAAGVAAAALALPVGWALAPAGAEPSADSPTTTVAATSPGTGTGTGTGTDARAERRAERQQRLADALGVSVEELTAARLKVLEQGLDDKVADGKITQDQADEILAAAKAGDRQEVRRLIREIRRSRR